MTAAKRPLRIAIGADEVGHDLKETIKDHLEGLAERSIRCLDATAPDVPEIAQAVAELVKGGRADRGVLVCGSGVGMVIAANKVPGIRAALCSDVYTAEHARNSDDAQIIVLGSRVVGIEVAKKVVEAWLDAEYEPTERRRLRMAKLDAIERSYLRLPAEPEWE